VPGACKPQERRSSFFEMENEEAPDFRDSRIGENEYYKNARTWKLLFPSCVSKIGLPRRSHGFSILIESQNMSISDGFYGDRRLGWRG